VLARASLAVRRAHAAHAAEPELLAALAEATVVVLEERALRDAEREARAELEANVRRFAGRLRQDGAPPEVGVRQIKTAVEPAVFTSSRGHDGAEVEWRRAVVGDVVRWFVESYYQV
jgi:regulator of protease activity HflC (stomatin/prohibitin superfamily)